MTSTPVQADGREYKCQDNSVDEISLPLTLEGIPQLRQSSVKLPLSVAAVSSSDMFKSPHCFNKPKAKQFDDILSLEGRSRKASTLKTNARYLKLPGIVSLGGGFPSPEYFPFEHIDFKVPVSPGFTPEETRKFGQMTTAGRCDIQDGVSSYDLSVALNYCQATGAPPLLRFVTEHTELIHNPPYSDWHCALTAGSTHAWDTALRLFCERGDYIIMEEYSFVSAAETAYPLGIRVVGVAMDRQGLIPADLDDMLSSWDVERRGARKPHVLYTIPTGQNPTGATQSAERRQEVYKIAPKHELYIIEDEPYYFLQMQGPSHDAGGSSIPATHGDFIKSLIPSYLSMDVDGRVCRLDSFAKVVAPGARVGWIVASEQIVERFLRAFEVSSQNPSGIAQIALYKLLDEHWGHSGYLDWLINLRREYTERRDSMLQACEKHMPTDIVHWVAPYAGMFHCIEVDWRKSPSYSAGRSRDTIEEEIFLAAVEKGVLLSRGSWFKPDQSIPEEKMFFRATFAAASSTKIDEAISRFADSLRAHFSI